MPIMLNVKIEDDDLHAAVRKAVDGAVKGITRERLDEVFMEVVTDKFAGRITQYLETLTEAEVTRLVKTQVTNYLKFQIDLDAMVGEIITKIVMERLDKKNLF